MTIQELQRGYCERCAIGKTNGGSQYCHECNRLIDGIINRAVNDGDLLIQDAADIFGFTRDAIYTRRKRAKRLAKEAK